LPGSDAAGSKRDRDGVERERERESRCWKSLWKSRRAVMSVKTRAGSASCKATTLLKAYRLAGGSGLLCECPLINSCQPLQAIARPKCFGRV
jgi:hypothetical protein